MNKVISILSIIVFTFFLSLNVMAQKDNGPGNPPGGPAAGSDQPIGGGAPIGGGLFILLGLGAAYGAKKVYYLKKEE